MVLQKTAHFNSNNEKSSLHNWKATRILFVGLPQILLSNPSHNLSSWHLFRSIVIKTFYIQLQSSLYGILYVDDFEIGCHEFSSLFEMFNWIKSIDNCNPRACIAIVFHRSRSPSEYTKNLLGKHCVQSQNPIFQFIN